MKNYKCTVPFLITISIILVAILSGCISSDESIFYDGVKRTYHVYIPSSYSNVKEFPLVIALHGGGGNSIQFMDYIGMNEKADEEGFIVVYANGSGMLRNHLLTWNAGYCCSYAFENNIDDVGFISALIDKLESTLRIDSDRIYVTGFSNGGMLTYRIGSELSDRIAAIAPVAASIGGNATEDTPIWTIPAPENPVPIIAFNSMDDSRVPYDGGLPTARLVFGAYSYLSVNDSISFWIKNNNCSSIPKRVTSENGSIIIDTYDSDSNADVALYTIVRGGHAWPGGGAGGFAGADEPIQSISATDIIWEFFEAHPKQ